MQIDAVVTKKYETVMIHTDIHTCIFHHENNAYLNWPIDGGHESYSNHTEVD